MEYDGPKIEYLKIQVFDGETIRKLFDAKGNVIGVIHKCMMTREEIEKMYPSVLEKIKE